MSNKTNTQSAITKAKNAVNGLAASPLEMAKLQVALADVETRAYDSEQHELTNLIALSQNPVFLNAREDITARIENILNLRLNRSGYRN